MKFVIEHVSKSSGRLGFLMHPETDRQYKTPLLLHSTKAGNVPFLTCDVFEKLTKDRSMLQMSLSTMENMHNAIKHFAKDDASIPFRHGDKSPNGENQYGGFLAGFTGLNGHGTLMTVHDPGESLLARFNEKNNVSLINRHGKLNINAETYMDLMEIFQPDIFQGLHDGNTDEKSSKKRTAKSVDRTIEFMEYCYQRYEQSKILKSSCMMAPIVGGYNIYERRKCIEKMKLLDLCGGYIFEGFHLNGLSATEVICDNLLPMVEQCLNELNSNNTNKIEKFIMFPGAYTPPVMLELIRLGVDLFDTSYAYCATTNFLALNFNYNWEQPIEKLEPITSPFINITTERNKNNLSPLIIGCRCLCCRQYCRAFVHHLHQNSELLGPILLMIHNLHHMMAFFYSIREAIVKDALPQLIHFIRYQGGDKELDYAIKPYK